MTLEDLTAQKAAAEEASQNITRAMERNGWEDVIKEFKLESRILSIKAQAEEIAAEIDPDKEQAADRRKVIVFHDAVRDLEYHVDDIKEGRANRSQVPGRRREEEELSRTQISQLTSLVRHIKGEAVDMHRVGLTDPLTNQNGYPQTAVEAEEYAVTALRDVNKRASRNGLDISVAMTAATQIADKKGELSRKGVDAFRKAMEDTVDEAQKTRRELNQQIRELRDRLPKDKERQPFGIERLEKNIEKMEERMQAMGSLSGELRKVDQKIFSATRPDKEPAREAQPAEQDQEQGAEALVFNSRKEAVHHLFAMSSLRLPADISDKTNADVIYALGREQIDGSVSGGVIENGKLKDDLIAATKKIHGESIGLILGDDPEKMKTIRENLDAMRIRLEAVNSAEEGGVYSDRDKEGANKLLKHVDSMEAVFSDLEAKKYGLLPKGHEFDGLLPGELMTGQRFAVADGSDMQVPATISTGKPRTLA